MPPARRHGGGGRRRRWTRSTWSAQSGEHPRIGAVDVVPFVPLGETTMDRGSRAGPRRSASASRPGSTCRSTSTRAPRGDPTGVKLADVRRGQYEGLRTAIVDDPDRAPDFGPRRPPSDGRCGGGRCAAVPHRLEHQPRIARSRTRQDGSPGAIRESGGGLPRVQANGFWIEELGRAQVSMNLLDFAHHADLAGLGDGAAPRRRAATVSALAESELIGLAPLAAFLDVADHAGARVGRPSRTGSRLRRTSLACAISRRCRRSSCASRRHARRHDDAMRSRAGRHGRMGRP